jgi:alkylation response protein AidB-like acyl-CoA dehydrogenase
VAFGRPLVGFQGVSFVLANLLMDIEAARLGVYDALGTAQASDGELEAVTSHLVAHVNRLVGDAGREGVELMGVHGVIADHPAERIFRSAAVLAAIDFDPLTHPLTLR